MVPEEAIEYHCPCRRVGSGSHHHFFGYYDKHIWDRTGRYLLANRVMMMQADLTGEDVAEVGFFDLENNDEFHGLGRTNAWNWQMGCQLQWIDGNEGRRIIFNSSCTDGASVYPGFCSTIVDVDTAQQQSMPLPVYSVAPNGRYALCINYTRLQHTHPTIGYNRPGPSSTLENAPRDDGIFSMDLSTGDVQLVVSLQALREVQSVKSMEHAIHWVTHLAINPSSTRFLFLHRWTKRVEDETRWMHRLFTVNSNGTGLRLLECSDHPIPHLSEEFDPESAGTFDYEKSEFQISHPIWKNENQIIVWGPHEGRIHYHLYDDQTGEVEVIGRKSLLENGHMTYSPNVEWILTDTYPDDETHVRNLILYNVSQDKRLVIGSFFTDPCLGKPNRCDLHPRWSRDAKKVCIDSVHESERQMYILDVSELMDRSG